MYRRQNEQARDGASLKLYKKAEKSLKDSQLFMQVAELVLDFSSWFATGIADKKKDFFSSPKSCLALGVLYVY